MEKGRHWYGGALSAEIGGACMRKLVYFTAGFAGAMAICAYFWLTAGLLTPAICMVVAFAVLLLLGRKWQWMRGIALMVLGAAAALAWFQSYRDSYLSLAAKLDGQNAQVTARCSGYSYQTDYGTAVEGILYLEGKPFRAKLYVSGEIDMEPGDVLTGLFRFRVTTPDGSDGATAHQGKGIFLLAYQKEDAQLSKLTQMPWWTIPAQLRQKILNLIENFFPEDAAAFAKALLLGDRTGLDYETNTAFKISGISHVIAVSGLHVTILFTLIDRICFKRRYLVALLGLPVLALFAAVAGFSPSVVRACIMQSLMILAMLFQREYDGPTELAFACLAMLVVAPLTITSVSFQLSVGCMIGIFLFQRRIQGWMSDHWIKGKQDRGRKLKQWMIGSASMTLSAMTLTTPLVALYFGCVSLVGVVTNLLCLWLISFIFYGIMLTCFAGWFWPVVGQVLGAGVAWPIRYIMFLSKMLSKIPFAAVYTRSLYVTAWLVFLYVLLAIFWLSKKKRPSLLFCCGAIGLCVALLASWGEVMLDACRMTVLDVGQGQCILLQSDGKTYLVDCGGSDDEQTADLAAETLMSQGIFRVDGVILTHYDRDHSGALPYFLSRVSADTVFAPDTPDADAYLETFSGDVHKVGDDLQLRYGDTEITIFGPVLPDSDNEISLAVLFRRQNCDILITGDRSDFGERMLMKRTQLPELEILVVGHHGSKNSTCVELLEATKPKMAAISVGENHYGHPAPEVLERLRKNGCVVYRTDQLGNLVFRR